LAVTRKRGEVEDEIKIELYGVSQPQFCVEGIAGVGKRS
jgi:hypothetical protein